jgi:hypothetical protein
VWLAGAHPTGASVRMNRCSIQYGMLNHSLSSNTFLTSAEALFLKLAVNASASIESICTMRNTQWECQLWQCASQKCHWPIGQIRAICVS